MHGVKIAIIDNGVDEAFLKKPLEYKISVTNEGKCICDNSSMEQVNFMHGTTCAMIIEKYFPECTLSSVKILNEDGTGLLTTLRPAIEWCLQHQVKIINLSLGSVHFKDKNLIRTLINEYSAQGLIIIAATSNSGYVSYPASLSHVIGVAIDSNEYNNFTCNEHLGLDVLVPIEHELIIKNEKMVASKNNSYAAPYITALAGRLYYETPSLNVYGIKRALHSAAEYQKIHFLSSYDEPDWIHTALVKTAGSKSQAKYYFNTSDETVPEGTKRIDTVIIDDLSEIKEGAFHDKNIIYLGNEKVDSPLTEGFFWSSQNRLRQILNSACDEKEPEFNIPIILCEWKKGLDEMFLLSELKKNFYKDGYHIYAVSFHTESVLYDLEYIPEKALEKEYESSFGHFIYRQTYYKQNDALLFGLPPELIHKSALLQSWADMRITFEQEKQDYQVSFLSEDIALENIRFKEIDYESIQMVFQKIKEILGNEDE